MSYLVCPACFGGREKASRVDIGLNRKGKCFECGWIGWWFEAVRVYTREEYEIIERIVEKG